MSTYFEYSSQVSAEDAGLCSQCRPSGVLNILQEAATLAACEFHASGPEVLEKYGALWMVTRMWYRLDEPLLWGEPFTVRTWHRGGKGAMLYRDFDLFREGRQIGEAVSVWVLVDAASRRPVRLSQVEEIAHSGAPELAKERKLVPLRLPEGLALAETRQFHYSDIDCNGHVNNVRYADLASDAVGLEGRLPAGKFVSSLQIGYLRECMAGERLDVSTAETEEGFFVYGADREGTGRFDALLALDDLPGKG